MAESVAGETGKPFVFVDPGAFTNMFFGIGVLKVKGLFRKLRKLALRYGGVVVFFDEADSLGNRGLMRAGGPGAMASPAPAIFGEACHGGNYLSPTTASLLVRESFVMGAAGGGGGGGMGTLQALLTELSGLRKPRGFINRVVRRVLGMRPKAPPKYRILVVMATNMPEALDEALGGGHRQGEGLLTLLAAGGELDRVRADGVQRELENVVGAGQSDSDGIAAERAMAANREARGEQ